MPLAARWMSRTSWDEPRGTIKSIILSSRHRSSTSSRVLTWEETRVCESHQIEECAVKCYKDDTRFSQICRKSVLPSAQPPWLHAWKELPGWAGGGHGWCWLPLFPLSAGGHCHWLLPVLIPGYYRCSKKEWQSTFIKMETKKLAKHINHRMCYGKFCRNTRCYYLFTC